LKVNFGGTTLQDTDQYSLYKTLEDLVILQKERDNMILEGIQSKDLCKICSGAGDKKTSGVDAENTLNGAFGNRYRIRLDNQLVTDNGIFYPMALYNDLKVIVTLAKAKDVVRRSHSIQLKYKLKNIKLEYEMIRSKTLADEAVSIYTSGKEFAYDYVQHYTKVNFKKDTGTFLNIEFNAQIRSLKALLLFIEPHAASARDSEKFIFPNLTKVSVMVNGSPNMLNNNGIKDIDIWREASRMFPKEKNGTDHMDTTKFYTADKFGLVIDMCSIADRLLHGSGMRLVNSHSGIQLQIKRKVKAQAMWSATYSSSPTPSSTLWTDSWNLWCIE